MPTLASYSFEKHRLVLLISGKQHQLTFRNAMYAMQDNAAWDLQMDEQIMSWAIQRPEDWQLGGRWEAFVWGGGRIGQLGEAGRNVLTPTPAQSFTCAQQVSVIIIIFLM